MNAALPNALTVARLVAVPVVVVLMAVNTDASRWWALIVFLVAAATDFLDGHLARRWGVESDFGKLADPIADKALILIALLMLVLIDGVPWWPLAVLAVREIGITVGRLLVARDAVIPASAGGKLKTVLQIAAVTFYLVPIDIAWLDMTAFWCLIAAVVVAVVSGVDYAVKITRAAQRQRAATELTPPGTPTVRDSHDSSS